MESSLNFSATKAAMEAAAPKFQPTFIHPSHVSAHVWQEDRQEQKRTAELGHGNNKQRVRDLPT